MSTRQIGGFTKVILAVHDYHDFLKTGVWPDEGI
jgi:hypothetical protein